ncbi:MAG: Gfo/Idh/MocA family oxidoreductase [Anaerococcus sp.]|nr:Gfo/Idh/MocA family oxidoreductase [Anaerococcus sp.]
MKLGIIGAGKIVHELLTFIGDIDGIDLVAIAATARSRDKLEDLSEKYNISAYYTDYKDLIKDPNVEVCYVALPNNLHYEVMDYALDFGKDVICEKPFAGNLREAEAIFNKAFSKNLLVMEAISIPFINNFKLIKEKIKDLGQIRLVSFNYSQYSSRYDDFKKGIIRPAFSRKAYGGALMDINYYNIALAVNLFGKPNKIEYFANINKDIDTSGVLMMDYGDFKLTAIGAKDSEVKSYNIIQADQASLYIEGPSSTLESFSIKKVGDREIKTFNENLNVNRLFYEFKEFERIIRDRDFSRAKELKENTLLTMELLTKARKSIDLRFTCD